MGRGRPMGDDENVIERECADRGDVYWASPENEPDPGCRSGLEIGPSSRVEQHRYPRRQPCTERSKAMIAAVVERCAGIDVGKRFLKVCVMVGPLSEEPRFEIRKVDCTCTALEDLRQWLKTEGITQ